MPSDEDTLESRRVAPEDREWIIGLYDEQGSFERFGLLPVRSMRLVVAAADLTRLQPLLVDSHIEAMWQKEEYGLDPDPRPEESRLYRVLRATLLTSLENEPAFSSAFDIAKQILPNAPPLTVEEHSQALGWSAEDDADVASAGRLHEGWPRRIQSVVQELKRIGAQAGMDPFDPEVRAFLLARHAPTTDVETLFRIATETWRRKVSTGTPGPGSSTEAGGSKARLSASSSGRRPVGLDYETARRTWWEMTDEYEDAGEVRGPNQVELCARLTAKGNSIKLRTLQDLIGRWRMAGLPWPPPRPTSRNN
jgi:hypothetical protein